MQTLNLSDILRHFEHSEFAEQYKLTYEEYSLLYGFSKGINNAGIMALMDCSRSTLTRLQRKIFKKLAVVNKAHAVSLFSRKNIFCF